MAAHGASVPHPPDGASIWTSSAAERYCVVYQTLVKPLKRRSPSEASSAVSLRPHVGCVVSGQG